MRGQATMILLVDNYDSFTYNLVQLVGTYSDVIVRRNDADDLYDLAQQSDGIIFSPGPGKPSEAGEMEALIQRFKTEKPMLGICLGHQALAEVFGSQIIKAATVRHGKTSSICQSAENIMFADLPQDFTVMRYHSLTIDETTIPSELQVTAHADDDGEIMAIQHQELPLYGLQFHPESIGTPEGQVMIKNFLMCTTAKIKKDQ